MFGNFQIPIGHELRGIVNVQFILINKTKNVSRSETFLFSFIFYGRRFVKTKQTPWDFKGSDARDLTDVGQFLSHFFTVRRHAVTQSI